MKRVTFVCVLFSLAGFLGPVVAGRGEIPPSQTGQQEDTVFDKLLGEWKVTCHMYSRSAHLSLDEEPWRVMATRADRVIRFIYLPGIRPARLAGLEYMRATISGKTIGDIKWEQTASPEQDGSKCPLHVKPFFLHVLDPASEIRVRLRMFETEGNSCHTLAESDSGYDCTFSRP